MKKSKFDVDAFLKALFVWLLLIGEVGFSIIVYKYFSTPQNHVGWFLSVVCAIPVDGLFGFILIGIWRGIESFLSFLEREKEFALRSFQNEKTIGK